MADTLNCLSPAPSLLYVTIVVPFDWYKVPYGSPNDEDAGRDEVNTQVPLTFGTTLYQSLSPLVSIVPVTGELRSDQVQYDEVDDPHSISPWVTTTVRLTPDAVVTVTVADRAAPVYAGTDNDRVPLPEPDGGVTVSHDAFDDADHDVFDETCTVVDPPADNGFHSDVPKTKVGGAGWVTTMVHICEDPDVATVTVADRVVVPVFADTDNVNVPLLEPLAGLTVNQDWFDEADHEPFDVIRNDVDSADADGFHDNTGHEGSVTGGWVTAMVRVICPDPEVVVTVTIADLGVVPVLADTDKAKVEFPAPVVGVTVNHDAPDDTDTDHDVFDVTDTVVDPDAADGRSHLDAPNSKTTGAGWVTVIVHVNCPGPDVLATVTVPARDAMPAFAAADNVNVPLPEPDVGATVNQDWFEEAAHDVLDDNDTVVDADADDGTDHDDRPRLHGVGSGFWVTVIVRITSGTPDVVLAVTVADLEVVPVFADADNVNVPLPEPEAGLTTNHDTFEVTDQDVFEVTDTEVDAADDNGTDHDDTPNTNVGATGWVTVTVRDNCGDPDVVTTVTVADRDAVPVFAVADNANVLLPAPDTGLTVNHDSFDDTAHDVFEVNDTVVYPADADGMAAADAPNSNVLPGGGVAVTI